jgi:hypothetical protein
VVRGCDVLTNTHRAVLRAAGLPASVMGTCLGQND